MSSGHDGRFVKLHFHFIGAMNTGLEDVSSGLSFVVIINNLSHGHMEVIVVVGAGDMDMIVA